MLTLSLSLTRPAWPKQTELPLDGLAPQPVTWSSRGSNGSCGEMAAMCYSAQITPASLRTAMAIVELTGYRDTGAGLA